MFDSLASVGIAAGLIGNTLAVVWQAMRAARWAGEVGAELRWMREELRLLRTEQTRARLDTQP